MTAAERELDELCGIPLAPPGWELSRVDLEDGRRLRVRYEDEDGAGWLSTVLLPRDATDRILQRLGHCAVYYEGELAERSFEHRARAAELLAEVSSRAEARLALAAEHGASGFPGGLAWRADLPHELRADPDGIVALLPELAHARLAQGWKLVDAYWGPRTRGRDAVCLELGAQDEPERIVLTLEPRDAPDPVLCRTAHFAITETLLGPHARAVRESSGAARATSLLVALLLELRDTPDRVLLPGAPAPAPRPARLEPLGVAPLEDAALRREAELLEPLLRATRASLGGAPALRRNPSTAVESLALTFDPLPAEPAGLRRALLTAEQLGWRRRTMRDYFTALGHDVHSDGRVRTVPTPESMMRLMAALDVRGSGLKPRLYASDHWQDPPSLTLELYTEGTIGTSVASHAFYARHSPFLALGAFRDAWHEHLTTLARRSATVLATHRVPHAAVLETGARVAELLGKCRREKRLDALGPLVALYEGDLPSHCLEIWTWLGRPEDFAEAFDDPAQRRIWDATLERRIREVEANLRQRPPLRGVAAGAVVRARRLLERLRGRSDH